MLLKGLACGLFVAVAVAACGASTPPRTSGPSDGSVTSTSEPGLTSVGTWDFEESMVQVGSRPPELPARLLVPDVEGEEKRSPVPAVVLVSNVGPSDRDGTVLARTPISDFAEALAASGMAALSYDNRFLVELDRLGVRGDVGVADLVTDDAAAAVRFVASREGVDPDRIVLVGFGVGGWILPLVAESVSPAAMVVVSAPAGKLHEHLVHVATSEASSDGEVTAEEEEFLRSVRRQAERIERGGFASDTPPGELLGLPGRFWEDVASYLPAPAIAGSGIPTLVLTGSRDWELTAADRRTWRELGELEHVDHAELAGLDHHLTDAEVHGSRADYAAAAAPAPEALDLMIGWIRGALH
ncbi:MAG: hypothetical protein KatS3mg008_1799 [Acidimicrobiales bacterium]|nr:MAG: hypothetical protein KatS3mg008_1799 [Acidimicrobiales bacterium]